MADKYRILICTKCGEEFVFTTSGQDYFAGIGYTYDPKRCKSCHAEMKRQQRIDIRTAPRTEVTGTVGNRNTV